MGPTASGRFHAAFTGVVLMSVACSRDAEGEGPSRRRLAATSDSASGQPTAKATGTPTASANATTSATTTATPPPAEECDVACKEPDDCPSIACSCEDGSIVNSRFCRNHCCAPKEDTCSDTCAKHDGPKGTWNEARDGKKTGAGCATDSSCASKVCLHGYCSKKCTSFGDCPPFWDCAESGNPFDKFCQKK